MGLALLAQSHMPYSYWDHSFTQAVYLINRLPTSALQEVSSPYHALYGKVADYSNLKVFGSSCFPLLRPYNKHKFQFRSEECVYLGLSPMHKGHKCLSPSGRIYISKDVTFNEGKFPYIFLFPQSSSVTKFINLPNLTYPSTIPLHQQAHIPLASPNIYEKSSKPVTATCHFQFGF